MPILALEVIGQHDAANGQSIRQRYLEGIAFHMPCDWAHQRQTNRFVVRCWGDNKARTAARLFMAGLRTKIQPHKVALRGSVGGTFHQISFPTGTPQWVSA